MIDLPNDLDKEVINLCKALNCLSGVYTTESCSGHGQEPFRIWFKVDGRVDPKLSGLFIITRCTDKRYWQYGSEWQITLSVGDIYSKGILPITFCLESKFFGEEAYLQADDLVKNIEKHFNHKNFINAFDINLNDFNKEEFDRMMRSIHLTKKSIDALN